MKPPSRNVAAVVVTYNRKELLKQALDSIACQTYPIKSVVVVDNGSTDGTREFLETARYDFLTIVSLEKNIGAAGGFATGIDCAYRGGHELLWVMDDDVITAPDALEKLVCALDFLRSKALPVNFLVPNVVHADGQPADVPKIDTREAGNFFPHWPKFLARGVVPIFGSTLVGMLLTREAISQHGLPIAEMFIWGEDLEYTRRLDHGFMVGDSSVTHLGRTGAGPIGKILAERDRIRIRYFYFLYRNRVYLAKHHYNKKELASFIFQIPRDTAVLLAHGEMTKLAMLIGGGVAGLFFEPKIKPATMGAGL
jgi:dTDP-4-dehydrorhamnose reductase